MRLCCLRRASVVPRHAGSVAEEICLKRLSTCLRNVTRMKANWFRRARISAAAMSSRQSSLWGGSFGLLWVDELTGSYRMFPGNTGTVQQCARPYGMFIPPERPRSRPTRNRLYPG